MQAAAGLVLVCLVVACPAIKPAELAGGPVIARSPFSHEEFQAVLTRFVDAEGRVDYAALAADPQSLERYYYLLSRYSPDSTREFFPTDTDRLAYWLNAYNAAVLKAVLARYPLESVADVRPGFSALFFMPRKAGFFLFQRLRLGGKTTTLYWLKNRVIRRRFHDPRVHFVLSDATRGSPRLRRRPLLGHRLDGQLDRATREFLAETRNLQIDPEAQTVYLSAIFDWYKRDFLRGYEREMPDVPPTILRYVSLYVSEETAAALRDADAYTVRFMPYDWRLNGRGDDAETG